MKLFVYETKFSFDYDLNLYGMSSLHMALVFSLCIFCPYIVDFRHDN